ncbi:hypothetical protein NPIL_104001 [Nephila pilipes]|uniref:Uncharacterized protein n=1 Tax=Nephila pilipes TaxID=299642 RepID=A0A8X6TLU0_NEPPI|nr:hypothetical protein NPIL_104001 [Nephila pilipes]
MKSSNPPESCEQSRGGLASEIINIQSTNLVTIERVLAFEYGKYSKPANLVDGIEERTCFPKRQNVSKNHRLVTISRKNYFT